MKKKGETGFFFKISRSQEKKFFFFFKRNPVALGLFVCTFFSIMNEK